MDLKIKEKYKMLEETRLNRERKPQKKWISGESDRQPLFVLKLNMLRIFCLRFILSVLGLLL